jgi:hypothetical protein
VRAGGSKSLSAVGIGPLNRPRRIGHVVLYTFAILVEIEIYAVSHALMMGMNSVIQANNLSD